MHGTTLDVNTSLSNFQRDALRKAISGHAGWHDYSRDTGLTLVRSSSSTCIAIANRLGIDCHATLEMAGYPLRGSSGRAGAGNAGNWAAKFASLTDPQQPVATGAIDPKLAESVATLERQAKALSDELRTAQARITELENVQPPRGLAVTVNGAPAVTLSGLIHPMFDRLLKACCARDSRGHRLNIWIAGPTGSGKSHAPEQIAEVLGIPFDALGVQNSDFQVIGYVSPVTGQFVTTPFVERFANGGIIVLDELDAYTGEATLPINGALANGRITLADGRVIRRHPDCIVIGTANTHGEGPTATFVSRNKLDGAFLSRFPVRIAWGYDLRLEEQLCGNVTWARMVQRARVVAAENGMKVIIDPRVSIAGAALIANGFSVAEVADMTFLSTLTDDQRLLMTASIVGL